MAGEHLARIEIASAADLRKWLAAHHAQKESVWLVTFKKGHANYVPYDEIVEEALAYGWVDSLPRKLDAERSMLLLSPRKPKSAWSAINKARVEKLIAQKRMRAPGLKAIETAKANGAWGKLDAVETLAPPDDLAKALRAAAPADAHFAAFPRSVRRGILEWIAQAKKPETRAKRIAETAALAAQNKRANQYRRP